MRPTVDVTDSDTEYQYIFLPGSPARSTDRDDGDESAGLDLRFLADLEHLVSISTDGHPCVVLLSELAFITASTALALWLLPIPPSYVVQKHDMLGDASKGLFSASMLILVTIGSVMVMSLMVVVHDAAAQAAMPATSHLRQRSLALLFLAIMLVNIAGFFTAIVPSLIYQALTANPRGCASLPALLLQASGYICAITVSKALLSVVGSGAALLWRASLTRVVQKQYLRHGAHYHLGLYRPSTDNPDQRITREIDLWSTRLSEVIVTFSTSFFNVAWYLVQTWMISTRPSLKPFTCLT